MGAFSRIDAAAQDVVLEIAKQRRTFDDLTIDDMFPFVRQVLPTAPIAWQNRAAARALEMTQGDQSEALDPEFRQMLRHHLGWPHPEDRLMDRRFYKLGMGVHRPEKPKVSKAKLTKAELAALADDMAQLAGQAIQLVADYRKYVGDSQAAEAAELRQRADDLIGQWGE